MKEEHKVRGSLEPFLKSGFIVFSTHWLILTFIIFIIKLDITMYIKIYLGVLLFFFTVIKIQTISIKDGYLFYSSNYFPILKRKIKIGDIYSLESRKDFSVLIDPAPFSRIKMANTDAPIIGMRFYDKNGNILGGFNEKVYARRDLEFIIEKLKIINPKILG